MMIRVTAVSPERRETVLSLMFSRHPAEERPMLSAELLAATRREQISLDGLLLAERQGTPVGTVLYILQADGAAFVWQPVVADGADVDAVTDALLQAVCRRIDAAGARLGQCILEPAETADREALSRNGFAHFADLSFLRRPLNEPLPPLADMTFQTIQFDLLSNADRFARMLERTYINTLDCPELNGSRTGSEALESHRAAGKHDPALWKIYCVEGAEVGVLLLADHPDEDAWEVVYMGVAAEARGHGYGRAMLLTGLYEARAASRSAVTLAVDRRNSFAGSIYAELGFVEATVRSVHVRMAPSPRVIE